MGIRCAALVLAGAVSLGFASVTHADLLVRTDGNVLDGKVVSQDQKQVVFKQDGSASADPQRIDRSSVSRVLLTDEHGGLVSEAGVATQPARQWPVPPEPKAPPVVRQTPGRPTYYVIPLHGEVGATILASALEKSLADAALRKPSVVVLDIESPGGLVEESQKITKVLHHYNKQLRIVALTDQDLSAAAIFTLSIKEIYVKSSSTIGAATAYQPTNLTLPPKLEEKMQSAWRAAARNSAEEGGHEPLLAEAMIDNDMELHLEQSGGKAVVKEGPGDKPLCRKGKILTLSSHEAIACGLAAGEADDVEELGKELKYPGWVETKGLGGALADYLPKRNEAFKAESDKVIARFTQDLERAKASDPEEQITRVVRTGPQIPRPPVPGRFGRPMNPGIPNPGGQTVVTTVSRRHYKSRSLTCVVALQQCETDLGEEASLCDAFGQQGAAELFREAVTQVGALRARIYDDRNKFGEGDEVATSPFRQPRPAATQPASGQPQQTASSATSPRATPPAARPGMNPPGSGTFRTPHVFDRRMPAGAVQTDVCGGHGGGPFVHVNPNGGPVVGFHYGLGEWGGRGVMKMLDPLYDRPAADQLSDSTVVVAKDGYVVAGLMVENDPTNVTAVQIIFARYKDGKVDSKDTYKSDWLGTATGQDVHQLAGKGELVIGTYGRKGLNLDAMGLVVAGSK